MNITGTFMDPNYRELPSGVNRKNTAVRIFFEAMMHDREFADAVDALYSAGDTKTLKAVLFEVANNEYHKGCMDIKMSADYLDSKEGEHSDIAKMREIRRAEFDIMKIAKQLPFIGGVLSDASTGKIDLVECYKEAKFFVEFYRGMAKR
ncbi:MAG: hypothetical protein QXN59_02335 [Candidatus Micrarchaeaceae archaeon]